MVRFKGGRIIVPSGTTAEDYVSWDTVADNNSGRTVANSTDYIVLESDYANRDGGDTVVKVLSSPATALTSSSTISAFCVGWNGCCSDADLEQLFGPSYGSNRW